MFTRTSDHPILECPSRPMVMERKWKPNIELAPSCPRCASSNTKFCYYNNYSLSQPRYFCKGCRRYWTKGGSLRNVPVRGGCRKSRRAKAARGVNNARQAPSPGLSTNESHSATDGAGIDLAAVFAKYLSPDSGNELKVVNDQDSSSGVTSGLSSSLENLPLKPMDFGDQLEDAMFECQNPHDLIDTRRLDKGLFPVEENVQDLLELQSMLSDETGEDMLWSDHTSLPNFAWQPMVQLEDFGSFSIDDDHMKMSTDLVCDTWSTFDPSGYEIFSRP